MNERVNTLYNIGLGQLIARWRQP